MVACTAMNNNPFDRNKPVHMARRDAHYERASDLLHQSVRDGDSASRMQHFDCVLGLLTAAVKHAEFITLASTASKDDFDFKHFLNLITYNVQSVRAMTQHQSHLEAEEGFLCQFLHSSPEACALPAQHYKRRADDLHQGILHLLRLAHKPYWSLLKEARKRMPRDELKRYETAYRICQEELKIEEPKPLPTARPASAGD